jgi:hypothetical protein
MYFDKNYQNVLFVYQSLQTISLGIRVKIKYPWKTGRGERGQRSRGGYLMAGSLTMREERFMTLRDKNYSNKKPGSQEFLTPRR